MKLVALVRAAVWFVYRYLRRMAFTLAGRNPLATSGHVLPAAEEWASVQGLVGALEVVPVVLSKDDQGIRWRTYMGEIVTPPAAGADYVGRLTAEMPSSVYALTRQEKVILDAGANIGLFSLYALSTGTASVIAFEPSPGNAKCLLTNLDAYLQAGRVQLVPKGVWSHATTLRFSTRNTNNPGGHHIAEDGEIEVSVTSIDEVVEELGVSHLDYIKMDVEGAEVKALDGARKTIARFRPRLCVATEHTDDLYENAAAVITKMKDFGYDYTCTETHPYRSPSKGLILTPFCVLFRPL
jgi:FkbM family methyltransferase